MFRRYPRFRRAALRAIHFFELALVLFIIVYLSWILNKVFDAYPGLFPGVLTIGNLTPNVIAVFVIYTVGVAFLFWIFSLTNPEVWKNIARMLEWEKTDE